MLLLIGVQEHLRLINLFTKAIPEDDAFARLHGNDRILHVREVAGTHGRSHHVKGHDYWTRHAGTRGAGVTSDAAGC